MSQPSEVRKMMTKEIEIGVHNLKESADRFQTAWHKTEMGQIPDQPLHLLTFADFETFLRILTPARWRLLQCLRTIGQSSIRALSKNLKRDYKNVHSDVKELQRIGLIVCGHDNLIEVPWDTIKANLSLAA